MLEITAPDVLSVYETDRDPTALEPFLEATEAFSDGHLAGKGLSTAVLKQVQRYLAAHFLFVTDTGVHESLRVDDVSEHFTKSSKQPGLMDSRFGRMAVLLDTSGTLRELCSNEATAEIELISPC